MRFRRLAKFSVTRHDDEYWAIDGVNRTCHVLNDTAGWLLVLADGYVALEDAVARVRAAFAAPESVDLAGEVRDAVGELAAKGLVDTREEDVPGDGGLPDLIRLRPADMDMLYGRVYSGVDPAAAGGVGVTPGLGCRGPWENEAKTYGAVEDSESRSPYMHCTACGNRILCEHTLSGRKVLCSDPQSGIRAVTPSEPDAELRKRLLEKVRARIGGITSVYLVLTFNCNFRCRYCSVIEGAVEEIRTMSAAQARHIAMRLAESPVLEGTERLMITFYGGEPLLAWDALTAFAENLSPLRARRPVKLCVITNGSLVTGEKAEYLRKHEIGAAVSLDGPADANDRERLPLDGSSAFAVARRGFDLLKKYGISPGLSVTLGEHNLRRIDEIIDLVRDLGVNQLAFNLPKCRPDLGYDTAWHRQATGAIFAAFRRTRELGIGEDRVLRKMVAFVENRFHYSDCAGMGTQIAIGPSGQVGPCHLALQHGHLVTGSVEDLMAAVRPYRDLLLSWYPIHSEECQGCPALAVCGGGCFYESYLRHGKIGPRDEAFCAHSLAARECIVADLGKMIDVRMREAGG